MKKGEAKKRLRRNKGDTEKRNKNALFRWKEEFFVLDAKKGKKKKQKIKQKKQINRVYGQVRWPFGPPHLTLKPSKKKQDKNNPPPKKKTKKTKMPKE